MWTKTVKITFSKKREQVQVWLDGEDENNKAIVKVQAIVNEYFLSELISFDNREAAYDFIKNYPATMALAFVTRQANREGIEN